MSDIDECTRTPNRTINGHICHHICTNTPGSYICSCRDGWAFNTNPGSEEFCVKISGFQKVKKPVIIVIGTCALLLDIITDYVTLVCKFIFSKFDIL